MKRFVTLLVSMALAVSMCMSAVPVSASELRYEAEDTGTVGYPKQDGTCWLSTSGEMVFSVNAPAGGYRLKILAATHYYHQLDVYVNGTLFAEKVLKNAYSTNVDEAPVTESDCGYVTLTGNNDTITLKASNSTQTGIAVDAIILTTLPSVGSENSLRLEAEDYNTSGTDTPFAAGDGKFVISGAIEATFYAEEAGTYIASVRAGGKFGSLDGTLTVNGQSAGTFTAKGLWGDMTSSNGGLYPFAVSLNKGVNTISIGKKDNLQIDYVEISKGLKYSSEMYSYNLSNDKYLYKGNTWGLTSTYLGTYDGTDRNNTKTFASAMTIKNDDNQNKYVYFPFSVSFEGEYVLKVTYSSRENSDAVVIVDPSTLPTKDDCNLAAGFGGTKKSNGKWQQIYSADENKYISPMFTEKYIAVGTLAAGEHNFLFAANEDNTENSGCAIRKVELVSEDMLDKKLIFTEQQMFGEAIREDSSKSTASLVSTIDAANTYSSDSYTDSEKNKTAVTAYAYNNSDKTEEFTFVAASYNAQGNLIGVSIQEKATLLPGEDTYLKAKADTNGAECVKTFIWDMETLNSIGDSALFGK